VSAKGANEGRGRSSAKISLPDNCNRLIGNSFARYYSIYRDLFLILVIQPLPF
jgi:hypothetical protein